MTTETLDRTNVYDGMRQPDTRADAIGFTTLRCRSSFIGADVHMLREIHCIYYKLFI